MLLSLKVLQGDYKIATPEKEDTAHTNPHHIADSLIQTPPTSNYTCTISMPSSFDAVSMHKHAAANHCGSNDIVSSLLYISTARYKPSDRKCFGTTVLASTSSPQSHQISCLIISTAMVSVQPSATLRPLLLPTPPSYRYPSPHLQATTYLVLKAPLNPQIFLVAIPTKTAESLVLSSWSENLVLRWSRMQPFLMKLHHFLSYPTQVILTLVSGVILNWPLSGLSVCDTVLTTVVLNYCILWSVSVCLAATLGQLSSLSMMSFSRVCHLEARLLASRANSLRSWSPQAASFQLTSLSIQVMSLSSMPLIWALSLLMQMALMTLPQLSSNPATLNLLKSVSFLVTMSSISLASTSSILFRIFFCSVALSRNCFVSSSRWNLLPWYWCSLVQVGQSFLAQRRQFSPSTQPLNRHTYTARLCEAHSRSGYFISKRLFFRSDQLVALRWESSLKKRQGILEMAAWERVYSALSSCFCVQCRSCCLLGSRGYSGCCLCSGLSDVHDPM